ncbi:MAG: zinc ribbon domain-containing protein [Armatimonadota bacterium]|nr:zinc ribbon domain-containing protein [Armatimonadota bacterium]
MPTYGYQCTKCDHSFEVFQKITDEPLTECEKCGSHVRKVLFPVGIVFKGSGFYVTDNRKPHTPPSGNSEGSKSSSETAAKTETPSNN